MARILIIDDDAAVRGAMQVLLQVEGFDVELAGDGHSGLAAVQGNVPDLVIVDFFMPGMDGRQTIRALRAHAPQLPIIAASGAMTAPPVGTDEGTEDPLEIGADFNLHKPFRPRELIGAVRQLLGLLEERG
jgi:DNA-binding response OmpR family regulator